MREKGKGVEDRQWESISLESIGEGVVPQKETCGVAGDDAGGC